MFACFSWKVRTSHLYFSSWLESLQISPAGTVFVPRQPPVSGGSDRCLPFRFPWRVRAGALETLDARHDDLAILVGARQHGGEQFRQFGIARIGGKAGGELFDCGFGIGLLDAARDEILRELSDWSSLRQLSVSVIAGPSQIVAALSIGTLR